MDIHPYYSYIRTHYMKTQEAEKLYMEIVKSYENIYGEKNRATIEVINSLCDVYRYLGKFEAAFPLCEMVLEDRRKFFGERHPKTTQGLRAHTLNVYPSLQLILLKTHSNTSSFLLYPSCE